MNITLLIGIIYLSIAVGNYIIYIPQEQKERTNFVAFCGFAIISPVITVGVYTIHFLNQLLELLAAKGD